jgi:glycyl-tRNA synthetase
MQAEYDEGGSIGKRYRRQDEIGTPWCITIDHQTLEDRTVTLRDRDSLAQERLPIDTIPALLSERLAAPWRSPKLDAGGAVA